MADYYDGPGMLHSVDLAGMTRGGPPRQVRELPVEPQALPSWARYEQPAGFGNGVGLPLSTADGRYVGLFGAHLATSTPVDRRRLRLLHRLGPLIAAAVDPLRTVTALAGAVTDATAGVVLDRAGTPRALPGLPGHRLLAAGCATLAVARAQLDGGPERVAFLAPEPGTARGLLRVTAMRCPPQPPDDLSALVLLSPPAHTHGLTRRELEVLGPLVEGAGNACIAATLGITVRTVVAHLEHILAKLGAGSRTVVAVRALRQGLYIPTGLLAAAPC